MDVQVRPRDAPAARCPYCHDALNDAAAADDQVRCDGCGTCHHLACVLELGRCTVMGCERSLIVSGVLAPAPEDGSARSRLWRAVQRQVRAKARAFVLEHCRAPVDATEDLSARIELAIAEAERATADGAWPEAADLWDEAARLEVLARVAGVEGGARRVDPARAVDLAKDLRKRPRRAVRAALVVVMWVLSATVVAIVAAFAGSLLRGP
ncbi:MAG: hypothetical protein M9894_09000 [Planctomycetes bacterium]|nr:hypothetical protein [Planctomycetota bacterium]